MIRQLAFAILLFTIPAQAEDYELSFPAQLNGLSVAPQQFEYALIDNDRIKIGDVIIDSRRVEFDFIQNQQNLVARARFSWPGGLFSEGEVAIRDSAGKLVWSQNIKDRQTQEDKTTNTRAREFANKLETEQEVQQLTEQLELYPFFRVCVQRRDGATQIFVCSKDLYVKKIRGRLQVFERQIQRPESFVEINGRTVSRQGVLVLNSPQESISFRAFFQSGVSLEISTRTKSVQFNNAYLTADKKQIVLRASGARPVYKDQVKDLPNEEWETNLDVERPMTYLQGEGQIPMKQEFSVTGNIMERPLKARILEAPRTTTASSVKLRIQTDPSFNLKASPSSTIEKIEPGLWEWTLTDLQRDQKNVRKVTLLASGQSLTAEYQIERTRSIDIQAIGGFPIGFGFDINYLPLHPAIFNVSYSMDSGSQKSKVTKTRARLLYVLNEQFKRLAVNGLGVGVDLLSIKTKDSFDSDVTGSLGLVTLSFFWEWEVKRLGPFDYLQTFFDYNLAKLNGDLKLKTGLHSGVTLRSLLNSSWYLETGLNYRLLSVQAENSESYSASQAQVSMGIGTQF